MFLSILFFSLRAVLRLHLVPLPLFTPTLPRTPPRLWIYVCLLLRIWSTIRLVLTSPVLSLSLVPSLPTKLALFLVNLSGQLPRPVALESGGAQK